jgi:outer membrane lipoprotein
MNVEKYITPCLMLAMLAGCAAPDPFADNLREQAKPLTSTQVVVDPQGTHGTVVIWGGRITSVVNGTNGGTLYIMQLPLAKNDKPLIYGAATGGFIARGGDFLDPEVYRYGKLITVAGEVTGVRTEMLHNVPYTYPVLTIRQTCLWPVMQREYDSYAGGDGAAQDSEDQRWQLQ